MKSQEGSISQLFGRLLRRWKHWEQIEVILHEIEPEWYNGQISWPIGPRRRILAIHYFLLGENKGLQPTKAFDPKAYRSANADVINRGFNLFYHYLVWGRHEGRNPGGVDYQDWIKLNESKKIEPIEETIKFSVLIPVFQPDLDLLKQAINSVFSQHYTNWELCLMDDASDDAELTSFLNELSDEHEQIKVGYHPENMHICLTTNDARAMANGEFLVFMDQDDLLHPNALAEMACAIAQHPNAAVMYSDEDKIDLEGNRSSPYFKSDFDLLLLLSQNYINHLTVISSELFDELGGLRADFEGSQDHDLLLRAACSMPRPEDQFVHIPKILYHWRMTAGSTALNIDQKGYAIDAGVRAVSEALESLKIRGHKVIAINQMPLYEIQWPTPQLSRVSIIIPTKDNKSCLEACINGLMTTNWPIDYEILVVDNGSSDEQTVTYLDELAGHAAVRVIRDDGPFNYSALNNKAVAQSTGDVVLLMNDDVSVLDNNWFKALLGPMCLDSVAISGAKLLYADLTIQHVGVTLGIKGVAGHAMKHLKQDDWGYFGKAQIMHEVSAVTGACLLVRKAVFDAVGGLNEQDLQVAFNDVDMCLKVREAGHRICVIPAAQLIHAESKTRGSDDSVDKAARFNREVQYMLTTWKNELVSDPFYNPNLSLDNENFELSIKPR